MSGGTEPFRYWVIDHAAKPVPADQVPPADWLGWESRYEGDAEQRKRAARVALPGAVAGVLDAIRSDAAVRRWCDTLGYAAIADPTLWGGGLHVTGPGGLLGVHLDWDEHPLLPAWRRAATLIAYLHPVWEPGWGGGLVLCDRDGKGVSRIEPTPGRLVAFEASDLSYHGVEPITGPAERVSVTLALLTNADRVRDCDRRVSRRRALFVPRR